MRSLLLASVALLVAADKADDDLKKIQGSWTVVSMVKFQKKASDDYVKKMSVEVKENVLTINDAGNAIESEIKLDPTKKPKTIDLIREATTGNVTILGIYELEGDTLKLCWSRSKERPTALDGAKADGLMVLKRKK
jgi:uncharacterized protein (TIGR03067 family)